MKRVLCILSSLTAGGAETFLMKVYRTLPKDRYQFDFIVNEVGGCYSKEVLERGGRIYLIPKRTENFWGAMKGIYSIVSENKYTYVLKLGNLSVAGLDLIAARIGGAKCLAMRSCNAPIGLTWKEKFINIGLRPLLNCIANVKLAPSRLAAEFTFGNYSAHNDVHLVNNGVDLKLFYFDINGRYNIRNEFCIKNKLVIGHIGRFHKQKNHRFLLETFKEISVLREDAVLLLVGTGELEEEICEWIKSFGLEGKIILTGQRFDIPQLLSAMDVFLFPSLYEGMPNTVIEAQATGLPCVIADTITTEANIAGLVQYLPLSFPPREWAKVVLNALGANRKDTHNDFVKCEYDIESVAKEFISILGMNDDNN